MPAKSTLITIELRTGKLHVSAETGRIPLRRLLGFSSRINSKRGFLLVSKVLGKHYPVTPRTMAWTYRSLAKRILEKAEFLAPSLWIGMAETATGLGYGVFEAGYYLGVRNALFMQTTRYHLSECQRLRFVEAHSHAMDFFLYWPTDENYRATFLAAKQLVLIDDEISTGATFSRLIAAYRAVNRKLERVIIVSLVNFASSEHRTKVEVSSGIAIVWITLLNGVLQFDPVDNDPSQFQDITYNVIGNGLCKRDILAWPGRFGIRKPIDINESITGLLPFLPENQDKRPVLVLGTGECNPPAYLLGRGLERLGFRVIVQASTRSPIFLEGDIASSIVFTDNYEDNIPNFLYNINPEHFRLIVFCHETPLIPGKKITDEMDFIGVIRKLNAVSAQFSHPDSNNAEFYFHRP